MPADGVDTPRRLTPAVDDEGLSQKLNHLAVSLLKFAQDRLDLLRWEAAHEGSRIGAMLLFGLSAMLLALFTFETLTLLIVAAFWDTPWRMHVIVGVFAAALIGTGLMVRAFMAKRNEKSKLLHPAQPMAASFPTENQGKSHEPAR